MRKHYAYDNVEWRLTGFNGAASLMDAETTLLSRKQHTDSQLQWGRITDGCGNFLRCCAPGVRDASFNGAASLMDAETTFEQQDMLFAPKLQWGRITDGCGNRIPHPK